MRTRGLAPATLLVLPVRLRLAAVALLSFPFLLISCGDGGTTEPKVEPVASVQVNPPTGSVQDGQTLSLSATVKDAAGNVLSGRTITWSSSNESVATVGGAGLVVGVGEGVVTITATCEGKSGTAAITVTFRPSNGFGAEQFALIPAGTFQMGDIIGNGGPDELPVHTVNITQPFYMQKSEVTQAQWLAVMNDFPSTYPNCGLTCPLESVSWADIQDFLTTLNAQDPGKNYRLPTEAEWEYAARAGTTGDYGGTGVLDDMAWYEDNSGSTTHPAAEKQPNAWGLYDMHGNVWEWTQDWYSESYYSVSPTDDPPGPATGTFPVARGGSYDDSANDARSACRSHTNNPTDRTYAGFRLVRNPPGP